MSDRNVSSRLRAALLLPMATLAVACTTDPISGPDRPEAGVFAAKQSTTSSRMLVGRNGQVWIMNDDGSDQLQLTFVGSNDTPSWAPDGKRVLFAAFDPSAPGIYSMKPDGTALTRITIPPLGATDVQPVALGKRVAFRREVGGTRTIYAVNLDGTGLLQLTPGPLDTEFSASPKGDLIAFASETGQSFGRDIYLLDVAKGGVTQLTYSPTLYKAGVSISPNAKRIAFTRTDPGLPETIFVMNIDGTEVTRLTDGTTYDFLPRWSPDGKQIGFTSFRPEGGLYAMLADGTGVRLVNAAPDFLWAWAR
jgi:Tol biopolymer transport system component